MAAQWRASGAADVAFVPRTALTYLLLVRPAALGETYRTCVCVVGAVSESGGEQMVADRVQGVGGQLNSRRCRLNTTRRGDLKQEGRVTAAYRAQKKKKKK